MKDTWYITTPIYYPNDVPHVGHAYTTVAADFLSRWHRLHGRKVHFLTGLDEHGPKMAQAAADNGFEPQAWTDKIAPSWLQLWSTLEISNDDFIRTTEARHENPVAKFMQDLFDRGDIYLGSYEGLYCVRCEEFKTESDAVEGKCPIHGSVLEELSEDNYFFKLSSYNQALLDYVEANPEFAQPPRARNELIGRLKQGLRDVPVSRPSVTWGIPIPWDPKHVIYVWIEALQNYITAVGYGADEKRFEQIWPADVHLIGKEIIWHHAIVWPAMLMAAELPLPKTVFAHGWLLAGGEKISKSGKSVTQISPLDLTKTYGVDGYRYHFLRAIPFGDDGNFSLEDMTARYNADLANDLGNLASRTTSMIGRYFDGVVPSADGGGQPEADLDELSRSVGAKADAAIAEYRITDAIAEIWEVVRHANRYLVEREPWKLAKDEANLPLVGSVLSTVATALARTSALLHPAMPGAMSELWSRLGYAGEPHLDPASAEGNTVRVEEALFPRLEV